MFQSNKSGKNPINFTGSYLLLAGFINQLRVLNFHQITFFFCFSKLILPEILSSSKDLKEVIVLDTDLVFQNDVIKLWEKRHDVRKASSTAAFGLVENQSEWYKQSNHWPAKGRGFNTGLIIILLDRLRSIEWMSLWPIIAHSQLNVFKAVQLADQDIFNTGKSHR